MKAVGWALLAGSGLCVALWYGAHSPPSRSQLALTPQQCVTECQSQQSDCVLECEGRVPCQRRCVEGASECTRRCTQRAGDAGTTPPRARQGA